MAAQSFKVRLFCALLRSLRIKEPLERFVYLLLAHTNEVDAFDPTQALSSFGEGNDHHLIRIGHSLAEVRVAGIFELFCKALCVVKTKFMPDQVEDSLVDYKRLNFDCHSYLRASISC